MSKESFFLNKDLRNGFGFRKYLTPAVLLGLILLLGLTLRLYDLGTESYWIDEMSTVIEGQQNIQQLFASGRLDQPPAYYLPFHLWVQIFGTSEVGTRSFSVLTGVCSIILIYLIGRELFGKSVGLLSAFLMAVTEFQIYYSQEARFYSFFEFMTLLSFLFFILALRSKKIIYFFLYGLFSIAMVYSHTYGIFILVAQNLFFFIQAIRKRNEVVIWLIYQAMIALAIIPYLFPLLFGAGGIKGAVDVNIGGESTPSISDLLHSIYSFVLSPRGERSWNMILINYAAAGVLLVVGISFYVIWQGKSKYLTVARGWATDFQEMPDIMSKILLISCWLLCPIVLPFIASLIIGPIYQDRYTISAAPALYLLLALGIFSIRRVMPIILSLGVLVVMIAPSLGYYYVTGMNDQWKEAAAYVEENSGSNEVIVFAANEGIGIQQKTFDWYYKGDLQGCSLGNLVDSAAISDALQRCTSGYTYFWVIIPNIEDSGSVDRYRAFFLSPGPTKIHMIKEQEFVKVSVYLFESTK